MSSSPKFDPTVPIYRCGPGARIEESESMHANHGNARRERSRSRDRVEELTYQAGDIGSSANPLKASISSLRVDTSVRNRLSQRRPYDPVEKNVDSLARNFADFSLNNPDRDRYPAKFKQSASTSPSCSSDSDSDEKPPTTREALARATHAAEGSVEPPAHQDKPAHSGTEGALDLNRFVLAEGRLSDAEFAKFGEIVAAILYS